MCAARVKALNASIQATPTSMRPRMPARHNAAPVITTLSKLEKQRHHPQIDKRGIGEAHPQPHQGVVAGHHRVRIAKYGCREVDG
ncbi:MAG: hypothetical protein IPK17_05195 [Chloroflexi bacterium]|uniref:hypothetical protein n=1 Tax=Candidatus Flexifilum breve TaxID=3140694 RepID=UPI0031358BBA|nr:hypothetical protein [Chloroflexota bacterium]